MRSSGSQQRTRALPLIVLAGAVIGCGELPPPDDRHDGDYERHALQIVPVPPVVLTVGEPARIEVRAIDEQQHAVTFELRQLPDEIADRVALHINADEQSVALHWTPVAGEVGRHQPKLIARDGHGELAVLSLIVDVVRPGPLLARGGPRWPEVSR